MGRFDVSLDVSQLFADGLTNEEMRLDSLLVKANMAATSKLSICSGLLLGARMRFPENIDNLL